MTERAEEIPVVLAPLAGKVRGVCTLGSDHEPIIVLNDQLSPEQMRRTYRHELLHIQRGDLWNESYHEYGDYGR